MITYEDTAVQAGARYGYRLEFAYRGETSPAGEVWVDVPDATVRLEPAYPNPATDGWNVSFSLADGSPATIEVHDLQGRLVMSREVEAPGPGKRRAAVSGPLLRPGVYTLTLRQRDIRVTTRGVIAR